MSMERLADGHQTTDEIIHTWESQYVRKLNWRNSASGDIAVCSLHSPVKAIAAQVDLNRVSFVGTLNSKTDLGWLLRGLYLNPSIRNIVLCGDDPAMLGEVLTALWQDGINQEGKVEGSGWSLYPEMDCEAVDQLRRYVTLWDWRDKSPREVAEQLDRVPFLPKEMEQRTFPPIVIAPRVTFPSRKTSFPMFADDLGDGWLQLLNMVLRCGLVKCSEEGDRVADALNAVLTIELDQEEEGPASFFEFNRDEFETYYRHFMSSSPSEYRDYSYGQRLQEAPLRRSKGGEETVRMNQLQRVVEQLKKSQDSRSGTMVLLDPIDLQVANEGAPNIISVTFDILDGELFGSCVLRATDIYNEWPLEAMSLVRLQREVAAELGVPVGSATFIIHSAHINEGNWKQGWRLLEDHFKRPLPLKTDPAGLFLFGIENGKSRGMLITHEADAVLWEGEFDDPEDLSWYLLDVMPWLMPQHTRYIGQECAALMRALKDGGCYVQG